MNDVQGTESSSDSAPTSGLQAGDLLRAAREAQGLHIAALAVTLKVPVKKLEALEAGRYSELPDMVFVRSLALSVCRTLKINPDQVMAALPQWTVHHIQPVAKVPKTEIKTGQTARTAPLLGLLGSPFGLGAVALMLATVALLFWRDIASTTGSGADPALTLPTVQSPAPQSELPKPTAQLWPPETPASAVNGASLLSESSSVADARLVDSRVANTSTNTDVNATATATATATSVAIATPAVGSATDTGQQTLLEFNAHGVSWIEVKDADGAARLRKLTADGDVLRVAGKLPLSVTVGRSDVIAVSVRGQVLDLVPLARDNVARFEVK